MMRTIQHLGEGRTPEYKCHTINELNKESGLIQTYPTLSSLIGWCTFWCTLDRANLSLDFDIPGKVLAPKAAYCVLKPPAELSGAGEFRRSGELPQRADS